MSSAISVILALSLAAEPVTQVPEPPRIPRTGILLTASIGFGLIATGAGFEIYGRTVSHPDAPVAAGTAAPAEAYFVGGLSLIFAGLCFVLIAVVLDHWYSPKHFFGARW